MFYTLSKVAPLLVYPAGLACCLLILALVLRARSRWSTGLVSAALLIIALTGNRLVAMQLVRTLEWRYPSLADVPQGSVDAIVVLGGGTRQQLAPRPWHEVGEAGDRVLYAARLYRAGVAPTILVSGAAGYLSNPGLVPESRATAEMLAFLGVPRDAIIVEDHSRNTYENAVESTRLLEAHGLHRIVLVTSAMHMPRAYAVFRAYAESRTYDLSITPAPTDYLVTYSDWAYYRQPNLGIQVMNLLPKAEYMEMTEKALKEVIGIAVYRLRGWL